MRTLFFAIILGFAWTSALAVVALGQVAENTPADLRPVVADLSHDSFAKRERATRVLWESGDEALVAEIVKHGATTEARSRAAQVLSSYRWGIVPGVSDAVRAQIEAFRHGSIRGKQATLSQLMQVGHLRIAAQCLSLVGDPVGREQLHENLRAQLGHIIPRELALGHDDEVQAFLTVLAPAMHEYHRDLSALKSIDSEPSTEGLSDNVDEFLSNWWLSVQSGNTLEQLRQWQAPGSYAAVFALLIDQQRIAAAIDTLRISLQADADAPAINVLRDYLAVQVANVKVQHYSKKALGLAHDADYSPTGIALSDGFRDVISFCHTYGLKNLIVEAGKQLAARLKESPAALPAFCAWAVHYPELRGLAIESAIAAHKAGVPAEFAYGPLCDSSSKTGRWFGQFITPRERRNLITSGARSGGWGALDQVEQPQILPLPVKGQLAMAKGHWEAAANAFSQGVRTATTMEEGAVLAYLASASFQRDGNSNMATEWRTIAESIPLANERARAALADTMQKLGDNTGAMRNRKRLISLYEGGKDVDPTPLMHTLRLAARSLDLSKPSDLAFAPRVIERSASRTDEIAQDAAFFYRYRLVNAIAAKQWDVAAMELQAAHQSAPGRLEIFELIAKKRDDFTPELMGVARKQLAVTLGLWEQAVAYFPGNVAIRRHVDRCQSLINALESADNK